MTQMETLVGRWEEIIKELSGLFEMRRGFRGGAVYRNPHFGVFRNLHRKWFLLEKR
jgi:hypothetical protein